MSEKIDSILLVGESEKAIARMTLEFSSQADACYFSQSSDTFIVEYVGDFPAKICYYPVIGIDRYDFEKQICGIQVQGFCFSSTCEWDGETLNYLMSRLRS